jgi:TolB-like protein
MLNHFTFFKLILIFLIILPILNGCPSRMAYGNCTYRIKTGECQLQQLAKDTNITTSSYAAADHLMRYIPSVLYPRLQILVTSLANIDNLEDSSSLGRLIGEQLSIRFAQHGYTVIEPKLQQDLIMIPRTGEFIFSRQAFEIARQQNIDMIVAGTYATAQDQIYITLKMLNCQNGKIMSSYAYTLPLGPNTLALLQKSFWWWW